MPNVEEVLLARVSPITCYAFRALLKAIGKSSILQGKHEITVFVPCDVAFETLSGGTVYDLLKDTHKLEELLNFHLVPMRMTRCDVANLAAQFADQNTIPNVIRPRSQTLQVGTLSIYPLTVTLIQEELRVNDVKVYEADCVADNGVIHILKDILWPPGLSEASFRSSGYPQGVVRHS
jgi:uncharacterized surface protein with fasciclin (FAS1) repeats